ncbi:hypothetical protein NG798_24845 [Ancylothrix sp. C2]|nr:hypothetical protein [Ancylothrix sp. D3o]
MGKFSHRHPKQTPAPSRIPPTERNLGNLPLTTGSPPHLPKPMPTTGPPINFQIKCHLPLESPASMDLIGLRNIEER